jgi:SAM-dependent methyltransferase
VSLLTPRRQRGVEILDDPGVDSAVRRRSLTDVTRSNRVLGGLRAVMRELRTVLHEIGGEATLLDVGTGLADIPAYAAALARRDGIRLTTTGVDVAHSLLTDPCGDISHGVCADARRLPFPDGSFDIVTCSQLLHHFGEAETRQVIAELTRVARHVVIVSDLRRSWIAAGGFWLLAFPLRFHRVTRHDGVASVLRGFTADELVDLVASTAGVRPAVRPRLGYRVTARWRPAGTSLSAGRPHDLGPLPRDRRMTTVDERTVNAPLAAIWTLASDVERWPAVLPHYRYVRFRGRTNDGGGLVEMSASRPFGPLPWPTWWSSLMSVHGTANGNNPAIRFRHVAGVTTGMDVAWTFEPVDGGTRVRIIHVWNGPRWPLIGPFAARAVIGPLFVHGIASRTLAGLATEAERIHSLTR